MRFENLTNHICSLSQSKDFIHAKKESNDIYKCISNLFVQEKIHLYICPGHKDLYVHPFYQENNWKSAQGYTRIKYSDYYHAEKDLNP